MCKRFLKESVLFMALLALFYLFFELLSRKVYPNTDPVYQHRSFETLKDKIRILILGSSQAEMAVNPQYLIKRTFNMAYSSQDLYYDYELLNKYLHSMTELETVALCLDYVSFGYNTEKSSPHLVKDYFWHIGIQPRSKNYFRLLLNSSVLWVHRDTFLMDLVRGQRYMAHGFVDSYDIPSTRPPGPFLLKSGFRYIGRGLQKDQLVSDGRSTSRLHVSRHYNQFLVDENLGYVKKIIKLARDRKVNVILFTTPLTVHYRENLPKSFKESFYHNIQLIRDVYPMVKYYDFSISPLFKEEDFHDANHLNYSGAEKFTILMGPIINADEGEWRG